MEDDRKELQEGKKETPLDKLKDFAYKHRKKIVIGVVGAAAACGAYLFIKDPENREKLMLKLDSLFSSDEVEIIDVTDLSDEELNGLIEETQPEPNEIDLGEYYSPRRLGEMIGESAQWVNKRLYELGYQEGEPGNWKTTEKGKTFSIPGGYSNEVGGYYGIYNPGYEWKKDIIYELGDPEAYRSRINSIRSDLGLPLLEKVT